MCKEDDVYDARCVRRMENVECGMFKYPGQSGEASLNVNTDYEQDE